MKKITLVSVLLSFAVCFQTVRAQCCCSAVRFSLVDKKGKSLDKSKIQIREITAGLFRHGLHLDSNKTNESEAVFRIGCGEGNEVIAISYKGAEIRIHFKYYGEFGQPVGKITFQKGAFIAEPEKIERGTLAQGIRIRKATPEESKIARR